MTELSEAINAAMAKYFKHTESILPGFFAHELTAPIRLQPWRVVMNPGVFFTSDEDIERFNETQIFAGVRLWTAHFELESMDELIDEAIVKGKAEREELPGGGEHISFKSEEPLKIPGIAEASPLKVPGREAPLTFLEAALWGAVQDAEEAGDVEKAHRLFNEFYNPVQITAESEEPLKQDVYPVVSHVAGLSKLTAKITEILNAETYNIDVSGKNEGRKVYTSIRLDYDDSSVSLSKPMDAFDREVQDAVATLYAAGNLVITPPQVYRAMTGAPNSRRPSNRMLEEIEASMDKQRRIMAVIDYSEELRGRLLDGESITKTKLEHWMIDASKVTVVTAKGTKSVGYQIHAAPILYEHDKRTRQITSYPMELLEATASVASNTRRNTLIRAYLIKRIQQMKNHSCPKQIKYETIMANIGEAGAGREAKKAVMEATRSYLDAFRKEGFIKAWKEYRAAREKAGRTITGVEIELEAVS